MNATYQRFALALAILIGGWLALNLSVPVIQIGDVILQVEIADTQEKREKGLSNRESLQENRGMLFLFEKPGRYGFWMKEMNFAIDIIWIDKDKSVTEITKNVDPKTFPKVFYSTEAVQYVVSTRADWTKVNEI
ncbi:DUF192 domain-containing protein, partial [Patescibacteria group bacterium]|nr:DUF192 domain-containing protein [Patescibacteria group bacterium]